MFSAWRESTMLKLAQVKIVFSVVIDDDDDDDDDDGDEHDNDDHDDESYSCLMQ